MFGINIFPSYPLLYMHMRATYLILFIISTFFQKPTNTQLKITTNDFFFQKFLFSHHRCNLNILSTNVYYLTNLQWCNQRRYLPYPMPSILSHHVLTWCLPPYLVMVLHPDCIWNLWRDLMLCIGERRYISKHHQIKAMNALYLLWLFQQTPFVSL